MKLLFFFLLKNRVQSATIIFLFLFFSQTCLANMKSPFTFDTRQVTNKELSLNEVVFGSMILFYSKFISPLDGARSPSYPTGSAYGLQAIRAEGVFMGILLIGDRLLHEASEHQGVNIRVYNKIRYYDPLENNIFWWKNNELVE